MDNIKNSKKDMPKLASKVTLGVALSATIALGVGCDYAQMAMQPELQNDNTALQVEKKNLANQPVEETPDTNNTTDTQADNKSSNVVQISDNSKSTDTKESTQNNNVSTQSSVVEAFTKENATATSVLKSPIVVSKDKDTSSVPEKSGVTETSIYDFEYELNDNDEVVIKGYTGTATEVVIPEDFNGYSVVEIGGSAFATMKVKTGNLIIPDSVESIENGAFLGCDSLKIHITDIYQNQLILLHSLQTKTL